MGPAGRGPAGVICARFWFTTGPYSTDEVHPRGIARDLDIWFKEGMERSVEVE